MITSISEIKAYLACPARWWLQYVSPRRSPKARSAPLTTGTIWHTFLEGHFNGTPLPQSIEIIDASFEKALEAASDSGAMKVYDDLARDWSKLTAAAPLWKEWLPCETLAVEKPLRLVVAGVTINGQPDRVVRMLETGKIADFQHKTLAATKPVAPYVATFHRQFHQIAYHAMLHNEYGERPAGVVLNIMRKLIASSIKANPEAALQQHFVPISPEQADRGMRELVATVEEMRARIEHGQLPRSNPDRDLGIYQNAIDPYFEVLDTGDLSLLDDDSKFQDTEDRYAVVETE